jgi:hypothetical protein
MSLVAAKFLPWPTHLPRGVIDGVERVCLFNEVFGKVGSMAVCLKCIFVFDEPDYETPSSMPHIRLIAVGARQFVYPGPCVYV